MHGRQDRLAEHYAHLAAEYVNAESNRTSLITVTRATLTSDLSRGTIFITVLPEEGERGAVGFLNRNRDEFRAFITEKTKSRKIPYFVFAPDVGEKHRRRLDSIDLS